MNKNTQEWFKSTGNAYALANFEASLANYIVVDVGKILAIEDGIATVRTYCISGLTTKNIQCEIIMIGNQSGHLGSIDVGQPCLIFVPRSPSASLHDETIDSTYGNYNERAAKCLPIATYSESQIVTIAHAVDSLNIGTPEYNVEFNEKSLNILSPSINISLDFDSKQVGISYGDNVSQLLLKADGSLESSVGGEYDKENEVDTWKSKLEQKVDGSTSLQLAAQVNSDTHESFGTTSIETDIEGNIKLKVGVNKDGWSVVEQSINKDGSTELKSGGDANSKWKSTITIDTSGNIKIASLANGEEKSSLQLKSDGTIKILTTDAYTLQGKNGVVIDGQNGKVSIKNSQKNLFQILKATFEILNSSLATQGSPAAHTVVPNQFSTQASDLEALME